MEALGDLLECGLPAVLAGVFDGDDVVDLPRFGALAVVVPSHPRLELLLDVPAEGLNGATEIIEGALNLVGVEGTADAARDKTAEVAHRVTLVAYGAMAVVLTDLGTTTLTTSITPSAVLTNGGTAALVAVGALTAVLTYLGTTALAAVGALTAVLANRTTATFAAIATSPVVLTDLGTTALATPFTVSAVGALLALSFRLTLSAALASAP